MIMISLRFTALAKKIKPKPHLEAARPRQTQQLLDAFERKIKPVTEAKTTGLKKGIYYYAPSLGTLGTTAYFYYMHFKGALASKVPEVFPKGSWEAMQAAEQAAEKAAQGLGWLGYGEIAGLALAAALGINLPIHAARWAYFRINIIRAARQYKKLITQMEQESNPQTRAKIWIKANNLKNKLGSLEEGPVFQKTCALELFLKRVPEDREKKFKALGPLHAKEKGEPVKTQAAAAPAVAAEAKTAFSGADLMVLLGSPDPRKVEEGLQTLLQSRENGPREILSATAIALEGLQKRKEAGQTVYLNQAFPQPQRVIDVLAALEKKPMVVRALAVAHGAKGRGIPLGSTPKDLEKDLTALLKKEKELTERQVLRLRQMRSTLRTAGKTKPQFQSLADLVRTTFNSDAAQVLKEVKARMRGTEGKETVKKLIALVESIPPAYTAEPNFREAARVFRLLAQVARPGLPLEIENADAVKARLEILRDEGASAGTRVKASQALFFLEQEIEIAPKGGGGGGGGGNDAGATSNAEPPPQRTGKAGT